MNIDLKKIEQVVIEDRLSKKNIYEKIIKDISKSNLENKFKQTTQLIQEYLNKDYYESKDKRINYLRINFRANQLAAEVFMITIPLQGIVPLQSAIAQLSNSLNYEDKFIGAITAGELLAVCCNADIYNIYSINYENNNTMSIKSNYSLDPDTLQYIADTRYLNPMICKPKDWTNNTNGGYLTIRNSAILGGNNHHNEQQALDVLNILQNIEFSLDTSILLLEEESNKPLDSTSKVDSFTLFKNGSKQVYKEILDQGNTFYFVWRYDKRGRTYSSGYYINLQSTDYKKALLNFTKKEIITT